MQKRQVHYTRGQVSQWLRERWPDVDWTEAEQELPPIVWRSRWNQLADRLGLPYTRKYIQNLDSQGEGPASIQVREGA